MRVALGLRNITQLTIAYEHNNSNVFFYIPTLVRHGSAKMASITNTKLPETTSDAASFNSFDGPGTWAAWCITHRLMDPDASRQLQTQSQPHWLYVIHQLGRDRHVPPFRLDGQRYLQGCRLHRDERCVVGVEHRCVRCGVCWTCTRVHAVRGVGLAHAEGNVERSEVTYPEEIFHPASRVTDAGLGWNVCRRCLGKAPPATHLGPLDHRFQMGIVVSGQLDRLEHWGHSVKFVVFLSLAHFFHGCNLGLPHVLVFGLPIFDSFRPSNKTCYFVPCGAGSLRDWDQAFALFLALFWFMHKHLPALRKVRWRKERITANWPGTSQSRRSLPQ